MANKRILITSPRLQPGDRSVKLLEEGGFEPIFWNGEGARSKEELISRLSDVDATIAANDKFTAEVMDAAPKLKVISRTGVGYDAVDVPAATERGIAVCITPGANRHSVAEFAMAFMLQCSRLMLQNMSTIRKGQWTHHEGRELAGTTVGIVGFGTIGKEVAQRARAFEMKVLAYDPFQDTVFAEALDVSFVSLEQLVRESDFVTLHTFLNEATHHMINAERLAMMKATAYLINTARGPIVDEDALYHALKEKKIAGAAMDVFAMEPLPADSPLLTVDNLYVTPHVAGSTVNSRYASALMAAENVLKVFQGERPAGMVNSPVLK
jgi:D-3-phosphoglycerate dehydrogenase